MSNIAAAAMMLASLRPVLRDTEGSLRRAVLLGVALGANFGGMATPVGSGPNALAISAASAHGQVTFARWMAFALPLTGAMLALGFALLVVGYRVRGTFARPAEPPRRLDSRARWVLGLAGACAAAWLTEPLHGLPAPLVALVLTALLFGTGLLRREDLGRLGIERAEERGDPEDHIAILCEVMAGLTAGRFEAEPGADRVFFERHLKPWAARFFADCETARHARFYKLAGAIGRHFMDIEADAFALDD